MTCKEVSISESTPLPASAVETLLKPENKGSLTAVLTYHVVAGNLNSKAVERRRWSE